MHPAQHGATVGQWVDWLICQAMRHWLAILLTMLMVFVTLPFLAPIAMAVGWTNLGALLYNAYIPFCHQLPQRSYFLFGDQFTYTLNEIDQACASTNPWTLRFFYGTPEMGWKVAWSDRMVSFYFLTPVFGLVYATLRKFDHPVRPISFRILLLLLLPMFLDGITHVLNDLFFGVSSGGFRDTNAWLVVLTRNAYPDLYAGDHFGTYNWWMRLITGALAAWGLAFFTLPWLDRLIAKEWVAICSGRE